jgi:diguanylate cyclase (GGDEF)-like protein
MHCIRNQSRPSAAASRKDCILPLTEEMLSPLGAAAAVALLGLVAAALLLIRYRRTLGRDRKQVTERLARSETQLKDHRRTMAKMRGEQGTIAALALSLPAVIRELNRGDPSPSSVPPLIVNFAEAIFQPEQILFYLARPSSAQRGAGMKLQLCSSHGFAEIPDELKSIPFGKGKIGWLAENRLDMVHEDWLNHTRMSHVKIEDNHPSVKLDIAGPLVHQEVDGERVLGVLCIGAPGSRPRNEKMMFQVVTNLGSLALVNAGHVTKLRELANTDGLTGLLNRRYLIGEMGEPGELARMINAAEIEVHQLSLFIFDIDHFKLYNDSNGHPEGDYVLRELAALVKQSIRPTDFCCRYGGEEFMVAMPETDGKHALMVAERIRKAIAEHPFRHREAQPTGCISISGGIASFPCDGNSVIELTQHADQALYESKRAGRNRVAPYRGVNIGDVDDEDASAPALEPSSAEDVTTSQ